MKLELKLERMNQHPKVPVAKYRTSIPTIVMSSIADELNTTINHTTYATGIRVKIEQYLNY